MPDLLLYACPPLHAKITAAQCDRNHERGAKSQGRCIQRNKKNFNIGTRILYAACVGCPGVASLARREGAEQPERIETNQQEEQRT